jgi:hypothetical protein
MAGLEVRDEKIENSRVIEGLEMAIVSHNVRKFFCMLLKKTVTISNNFLAAFPNRT